MFAKLLKYEWKSVSPVLWLLSLLGVGAGLLGAGAMRFMNYCSAQTVAGSDRFVIPMILMALLLIGVYLAIAGYSVGSQIILYYRFYKSRFTDEGYLTFTLPVTAAQIFWSSFVVILIWSLLSTIISIAAFLAPQILGTLGTEDMVDWEVLREYLRLFEYVFEEIKVEMIITGLVSVASFLASIFSCMAALTVGSVIVKRYKLLAGIGVYLGANTVIGLISGTFSIVAMIMTATAGEATMIFLYVVELITSIVLAAGACVLNIWLMKNKLNLP